MHMKKPRAECARKSGPPAGGATDTGGAPSARPGSVARFPRGSEGEALQTLMQGTFSAADVQDITFNELLALMEAEAPT